MSLPLAEAATNPSLGVVIFTLGGLAGAVFYLPFKKVKEWSWESYWMIYAIAGLVVVPLVLALATSPNVFTVLGDTPAQRTCLLLRVRRVVGHRRHDLGAHDPLPGGRPWVGHRLRFVLGHRHARSADSQGQYRGTLYGLGRPDVARRRRRFSAGHHPRRHGRNVEGKRTARGSEEKGRRRVRLQEGHPCRHLLRRDSSGDEFRAARRSDDRETCLGDIARPHRRPGRGIPCWSLSCCGGFTVNACSASS